MDIIGSGEFYMREPHPEDVGLMARLYQHHSVMEHIGAVLDEVSALALANQLIQQSEAQQALIRLVFHQQDTLLAGLISLHWRESIQAVEFGIMIRPEYQKHGLSRSALVPVMRQASDFFQRPVEVLSCFIKAGNINANEGCRKLGFHQVPNHSKVANHRNKNRWNVTLEELSV